MLCRNAGGLSWSHYSSGHASSLDAAALSHLEARQLRMRGLDQESDRPLRACGAAPDLADVIFKTVRQVDPSPVLPARNRIAPRLTAGLLKEGRPGSVSRPLIVRSRASRCSGDAFASTIDTTSWHFPYVGSELNWQGQP